MILLLFHNGDDNPSEPPPPVGQAEGDKIPYGERSLRGVEKRRKLQLPRPR